MKFVCLRADMNIQEIDEDSDKENEQTISEEELDSILERETRPIVLKFGASWCGPCVQATPPFKDLITKMNGDLVIVGIDRDDDDADTLFNRYNVQSMPTFIVVKNNIERFRTRTVHELSTKIREIVSPVFTTSEEF